MDAEFTSLEFYMAYADVYDLMTMTEDLVSSLVKHIHGSYNTVFHTAKGDEYKVNWEGPWRRIEMIPALEELTGETFPPADQMHTEETGELLKKVMKKMNVECNPPLTNARMLDSLVGDLLESQCVSLSTSHACQNWSLTIFLRSTPPSSLVRVFEIRKCWISMANLHLNRSPADDVPPGQELSFHSRSL